MSIPMHCAAVDQIYHASLSTSKVCTSLQIRKVYTELGPRLAYLGFCPAGYDVSQTDPQ